MKFEEALSKLREGKKIRHPSFEKDEYLMGCYLTLPFTLEKHGKEESDSFDVVQLNDISITYMLDDKIHLNMRPRLPFLEYVDLCEKYPFLKDKLTYPTINILLIMSDDWEIIE